MLGVGRQITPCRRLARTCRPSARRGSRTGRPQQLHDPGHSYNNRVMPSRRPPTPDRDRRSHPGAWLWHRLAVSLALRRDEDAERIRTVTFGWLFGLGFAALGLARQVPGAGLLGESPFELDQALRTVTLGWFATDRARPLTLVDIDTDTYAGWRQPLMTPRADLVRMLETVTAARPEAVIVDIDLSGDAGSIVPAGGASAGEGEEEVRSTFCRPAVASWFTFSIASLIRFCSVVAA